MGLAVESSQLTFLGSSKLGDTKNRTNIKIGLTKFRYCAAN